MSKATVRLVWARKSPKIKKLLEIHAAYPQIFKKIHGILSAASLNALRKRALKFKESLEKLEKTKKEKEKKFSAMLLPKIDAVDDTYDLIKARIKAKHPEIYDQYF